MSVLPPRRPLVLVVEDDTDVRDSIEAALAWEGYATAAAPEGREALRLLERHPPPCLILLDLMMPVMNGRTFLAEMSRRPVLSSIPVVVLSATAELEVARRTLPATAFLQKPVSLDTLLEVVARLCGPPDPEAS